MAKNDFQYGGWNYYTLQCGTIMTLISAGDCTLQFGMWIWNHDSEFTKWQHPAILYVARSWRWFRQVTAPCNLTRSSGIMTLNSLGGSNLQCGRWLWDDMPCNLSKRLPYWNSTSGFDFDHITASKCHAAPVYEILFKSDHPQQKKMMSCQFSRWRISAILDFRGTIMGSLKIPCTTSYRMSIETTALNSLVFEKMAFLHFSVKIIAIENLVKIRVWQLTTTQSHCWVCVTSFWSLLLSSAFLPQTRLVSGKVEALVTRLLPSPLTGSRLRCSTLT